MQARIVGAARGVRWLGEGWRLFRAAPLGWLGLVLAYWLFMTVISLVPFIGVAVAGLLVPGMSVGFMAAARAAERGGRLEIALLFDGLRQGARAQLLLGAVYLASLALVLAATVLADGGALAEWMMTGRRPDDQVLQSNDFVTAMALAASLYIPVMMMFWFAPVLSAWHSAAPAKALFFSFAACLMNWRAFTAYGAVVALVTLVLPFVALSGLLLLSGGTLRVSATALVFPLLIVVLPTLLASFYASYRDVFGTAQP